LNEIKAALARAGSVDAVFAREFSCALRRLVLPHSIVQSSTLFRLVAALLVATALSGVAVAGAPAKPLELHIVDILGARVDVAPQARNPTILIFMSRRAQEASAAFARAVDERLIDRPIESIGVVDVRRYGGILRRLATSYLRRSAEEAKVRRRARRQARGVDASAAAVDRWHLVGDFDGSLFGRFGVEAEPKQPLAFVVDGAGELHGPFRDVEPVVVAASAVPALR
jgi:hypothetical protein